MIWLVLGVWLVCVGVLLHLHFEVRRTRYRAPVVKYFTTTNYVDESGRTVFLNVAVLNGTDADIVERFLERDLELAREGK